MNQSPVKPWKPGTHPSYSAFRLLVNVCVDAGGNVWSDHNFFSVEDEVVARGLRQGGAPQVAHGLLTEAIRREAFMCALLSLTQDPSFFQRYKEADPAGKEALQTSVRDQTRQVISSVLGKMTPGLVAEVLEMMADQAPTLPSAE